MNAKFIQIACILLTLFYGVFVGWIYWAAPKNLTEIPTKAIESVEKAASTATVITKTYEIDRVKFEEGIDAFRKENYVLARDRFSAADPEKQDAATQYYIAYSFYREGWGRFANDDELFGKALNQLKETERIDREFKSNDPDLKLSRPAELRNELEEGLRLTASDFNPLKAFRERK